MEPAFVNDFRENGYCVVENVLSQEEVGRARQALHAQLSALTGRDTYHEDVSRASEGRRGGGGGRCRLKSPAAGILYSAWKMFGVHLHPRVVQTYDTVLSGTYAKNDGIFTHPFGVIESPTIPYIDRVCYRTPGEGGIALHIDRNPLDPYLTSAPPDKRLSKWRPIQCLVCLTDHFGTEDGGLRVVPGFHKRIDYYFARSREARDAIGTGGEFFRFKDRAHTSLERELQPVIAPSGAMVLWDNRLPHATCERLNTGDTREVVYTQFLPNIALNRSCSEEQWRQMMRTEHDEANTCDKNWLLPQETAKRKQGNQKAEGISSTASPRGGFVCLREYQSKDAHE